MIVIHGASRVSLILLRRVMSHGLLIRIRLHKPGPQQHPPVSHASGTPKKPCKIGCGLKCLGLFCHRPYLLDCTPEPGLGFYDPDDPDPEGPPSHNPEPSPEPSPSPTSCSESTVTDFWVSCITTNSGSSSCTTISSSVVTGCDVTASATTTGVGSCQTQDPERTKATMMTTPQTRFQPAILPPQLPSLRLRAHPLQLRLQNHLAHSRMRIPIGASSAYCICEGSLNYPEPSITGDYDFAALPSQAINPTSPPSVVTSNYQVCTIVEVNNGECSTIAGCTLTG